MAASSTAHGGSTASTRDDGGKTPAQWYCLLGGAALLLAGIAGFFADAAFDTGSNIQGDKLLGIFEVNGIHNLIHIASGLLLLAASPKRASAKLVAIGFGAVYGIVAIIGLIDGETVLGLIPINSADNILHIALALVGILAGVASSADDRAGQRSATGSSAQRTERFERGDVDTLTGAPRGEVGEGRLTR
jgi:hypothetical protein